MALVSDYMFGYSPPLDLGKIPQERLIRESIYLSVVKQRQELRAALRKERKISQSLRNQLARANDALIACEE